MRKKATNNILDYFRYIKSRLKYIKSGILVVSDNEHEYYKNLWKAICEYAKCHKIYFQYITEKIDLNEVGDYIGLGDRCSLRYLKNQKANLIRFINATEDRLLLEFPFENGEQELAEVV